MSLTSCLIDLIARNEGICFDKRQDHFSYRGQLHSEHYVSVG